MEALLQQMGPAASSFSLPPAGMAGGMPMPFMAGVPAGGKGQQGHNPCVGTELPAGQTLLGKVKSWLPDKGFAFLIPDVGGPDVFCHQNQITDGSVLQQGLAVAFQCRYNDKRNKFEATSCSSAANAGAMPQGGAMGGGGFAPANPETRDNLFVADLPENASEQSIRDLFANYGQVKSVRVLPTQPGRPKGAALVRLADENQARWCVENLNGNIPVGLTSPITVRFAGGSGGGGGGMMGGGFGPSPLGGIPDARAMPYGMAGMPQQAFASFPGQAAQPNLGGIAAAVSGLVPLLNQNPQMLQLLRNAHATQQVQQGAGGFMGMPGALPDGGLAGMPGALPDGMAQMQAQQMQQAMQMQAAQQMQPMQQLAAQPGQPQLQAGAAGIDLSAALANISAGQTSGPMAAATAGAPMAAANPWVEAKDPATGMSYYYHSLTRETRWDRPAEMGPIAG